jgi:hypothetical protein
MEILTAFVLGLVVYFGVMALYYSLAGCPREIRWEI